MSRRVLLLLAAALPAACIPSNVVAEQDRAVRVPAAAIAFTASVPPSLHGLYESVSITGDVAAAMERVWYWFAADGRFTGAALLRVDGEPRFETLSGRYRIANDKIWLGDEGAPATLAAAPEHLRLSAPDGTMVLHRLED